MKLRHLQTTHDTYSMRRRSVQAFAGRVLAALLTHAACSRAEPDPRSAPLTCRLSSTKDVFTLDLNINLKDREVVFRKEPDFEGNRVIRGAIPTGTGRTDFVGFALDTGKRELHLDVNRNLDLTDDPSGTVTAEDIPAYFKFENLSLETGAAPAPIRYVFDLVYYDFGPASSCEARIRSGWQADAELAEGKWRIGVADNFDGVIDGNDLLVLRRLDPGAEDTEASDADRLRPATNLAIDGYSYEVAFRFRGDAPAAALEATFAPAQPPSGSLRVEGTSVKRVLMRGPFAVVIERPAGPIRMPAGHYEPVEICIGPSASNILFQADAAPLTVAENEETVLRTGAPLSHCVAVRRVGPRLSMDYSLKDAGGNVCREIGGDTGPPPRFVIVHNGREAASGSFEYG